MRIGLVDMLGVGPRAVGRYTGTLLAVFIAQTLVAIACLLAVTVTLGLVFDTLPIWDEAVDGDLVALVYCARFGKDSMLASAGIVVGGLLLWTLASWFIVGGIYGVLAQRPEGRAETARAFGASGAGTYLAYARIALCSIPGWLLGVAALQQGLGLAWPRMKYALTVPQLLGPLVIGVLPALLIFHFVWTVSDYARVELTLRTESHNPSAVLTYLRTLSYVIKRPITLAHGALGWFAFAIVTAGYAFLAQGHPMYGAEGAVTLFVIRQGVALARTAIRFGVLAGQLELGKTRALPSRRVDVKAEPKT